MRVAIPVVSDAGLADQVQPVADPGRSQTAACSPIPPVKTIASTAAGAVAAAAIPAAARRTNISIASERRLVAAGLGVEQRRHVGRAADPDEPGSAVEVRLDGRRRPPVAAGGR